MWPSSLKASLMSLTRRRSRALLAILLSRSRSAFCSGLRSSSSWILQHQKQWTGYYITETVWVCHVHYQWCLIMMFLLYFLNVLCCIRHYMTRTLQITVIHYFPVKADGHPPSSRWILFWPGTIKTNFNLKTWMCSSFYFPNWRRSKHHLPNTVNLPCCNTYFPFLPHYFHVTLYFCVILTSLKKSYVLYLFFIYLYPNWKHQRFTHEGIVLCHTVDFTALCWSLRLLHASDAIWVTFICSLKCYKAH